MAIDQNLAENIVRRRLQYFLSINESQAIDAFIKYVAEIVVAAQDTPVISGVIASRLAEMKTEKEAEVIAIATQYDSAKEAAINVLTEDIAAIDAALGITNT